MRLYSFQLNPSVTQSMITLVNWVGTPTLNFMVKLKLYNNNRRKKWKSEKKYCIHCYQLYEWYNSCYHLLKKRCINEIIKFKVQTKPYKVNNHQHHQEEDCEVCTFYQLSQQRRAKRKYIQIKWVYQIKIFIRFISCYFQFSITFLESKLWDREEQGKCQCINTWALNQKNPFS